MSELMHVFLVAVSIALPIYLSMIYKSISQPVSHSACNGLLCYYTGRKYFSTILKLNTFKSCFVRYIISSMC